MKWYDHMNEEDKNCFRCLGNDKDKECYKPNLFRTICVWRRIADRDLKKYEDGKKVHLKKMLREYLGEKKIDIFTRAEAEDFLNNIRGNENT